MELVVKYVVTLDPEIRGLLELLFDKGSEIMDQVTILGDKIAALETAVQDLTTVNAAQVASINAAIPLLKTLKGDLDALASNNSDAALAGFSSRIDAVLATVSGDKAAAQTADAALDAEVASDTPAATDPAATDPAATDPAAPAATDPAAPAATDPAAPAATDPAAPAATDPAAPAATDPAAPADTSAPA